MKNFLGAFAGSLVLCIVIVSLGESTFLNSFWGIIIFISLIMAISITGFLSQDTKIEDLEKRLTEFEFKIKEIHVSED